MADFDERLSEKVELKESEHDLAQPGVCPPSVPSTSSAPDDIVAPPVLPQRGSSSESLIAEERFPLWKSVPLYFLRIVLCGLASLCCIGLVFPTIGLSAFLLSFTGFVFQTGQYNVSGTACMMFFLFPFTFSLNAKLLSFGKEEPRWYGIANNVLMLCLLLPLWVFSWDLFGKSTNHFILDSTFGNVLLAFVFFLATQCGFLLGQRYLDRFCELNRPIKSIWALILSLGGAILLSTTFFQDITAIALFYCLFLPPLLGALITIICREKVALEAFKVSVSATSVASFGILGMSCFDGIVSLMPFDGLRLLRLLFGAVVGVLLFAGLLGLGALGGTVITRMDKSKDS